METAPWVAFLDDVANLDFMRTVKQHITEMHAGTERDFYVRACPTERYIPQL